MTGEVLYFCAFQTVRTYAQTAARLKASLPSDIDRILEDITALSRRIAPFRPVLCHNDLLPANLIDDGQRLWLLDWEYAAPAIPCSTWRMRRRPRASSLRAAACPARCLSRAFAGRSSGRAADLQGRRAFARIALVDDPDSRVGHRIRLPALCPRESRGLPCRAGRSRVE